MKAMKERVDAGQTLKDIINLAGRRPNKELDITSFLPFDIPMEGRPVEAQLNSESSKNGGITVLSRI